MSTRSDVKDKKKPDRVPGINSNYIIVLKKNMFVKFFFLSH